MTRRRLISAALDAERAMAQGRDAVQSAQRFGATMQHASVLTLADVAKDAVRAGLETKRGELRQRIDEIEVKHQESFNELFGILNQIDDPDQRVEVLFSVISQLDEKERAAILRGSPPSLRARYLAKVEEKRSAKKRFHESCVRLFLNAQSNAVAQARGDAFSVDGETNGFSIERARNVVALLLQARLIAIEPTRYGMIYRGVDKATTEAVGGVYKPFDENSPLEPQPEIDERLPKLWKAIADKTPFPSPLPFDAVFFCYGDALVLSRDQLEMRIRPPELERLGVERACLVGHLLGTIGDQSYAFVALLLEGAAINDGKLGAIALGTAYDKDGWTQPYTFDAPVLDALTAVIDKHKTLTKETPTLGMRMDAKAAHKRERTLKPIPPPFYTVELRDSVIEEQLGQAAQLPRDIVWSHRWDVRGHERIRVAQGDLPIDPKVEARLKARGYTIATALAPLPREDAALLKERGVEEPARDKWLAVKRSRVTPYVKGPKDKPYVPSLRTMP